MGDEEYFLLQKLCDDDMAAIEVLYIRYGPQVKSFVSAILKNQTDTEDLVQDIFLKIWEERHKVCQVSNFKSYLYIMTRNMVYNKLKHDRIHNKYVSHAKLKPSGYDIEDRIATKELLTHIHDELNQLTEQQRIIFELNRNNDLTYKEIADKLGISTKTVQYHIGNVLNRLKKLK